MFDRLRKSGKPQSPWNQRGQGFSLPELLVIVVILGVISAVGIQAFFFLVRRARVQSVALEIAGWIENVRNAAADNVDRDDDGSDDEGGCVVDFTLTASQVGEQLAEATCETAATLPENILRIPPGLQAPNTVSVSLDPGTEPIVFTPRGMWTQGESEPGQDFRLLITLDGGGPSRCVRLSPVLGSVDIGRPNGSVQACADGAEWETL